MFSVVNTFILNPVPLEGGSRLVEINEIEQMHDRRLGVSAPLYHYLESQSEIFEKMASFRYDTIDISGEEFLESVWGCRVTPSFFEIFSIPPLLGRVFHKEEGKPGNDDVVIISHSLWQRRFGGDAEIVGAKLKTRNKTFTIVGVMPPHFQYPSRNRLYWCPFQFASEELTEPVQWQLPNWSAIARLRRGVSRAKIQAFLDVLNERLAKDLPGPREGRSIRERPLRDSFVAPELQKTLWALMGAIGFVLLIACANLANLQLARTESRLREVTVRMALGAGRRRIVRQLLTETLLLSLLGGLGGVLVAACGVRVASLLIPSFAPQVRPMAIDRAMLLCTLALSVMTGIAFGSFPARYACGIRFSESLKQSGVMVSGSSGQRRVRNTLVVGEVALAFVLLVGAALMIQSLLHVLRVNPGYDPTNLARISLTMRGGQPTDFDEWCRNQFPALTERLAALPGTTAAGFVRRGSQRGSWQAEGMEKPVRLRVVHVGVGRCDPFRVLRVPLREGRFLERGDTIEGQTSIVVNESLAQLCWPGEDPIGKRVRLDWEGYPWLTVVGVVGDYKEQGYDEEVGPTIYEPFERTLFFNMVHFLVRTSLDPASLMQAVHRDVKEILRDTHAPSIDWAQQVLWASTYSRRLYMHFLCAFGGAGLFLSGLGILGVLAYSVNRRTREIGIRMALGAQKCQVIRLVVSQGMRLVLGGAALGLLGAVALTRILENQLFGVRAIDPLSIAAGGCLLVTVGLVACYVPGRRAAKVDPMVALRYE
jgi:putative ABC transport system permease protein